MACPFLTLDAQFPGARVKVQETKNNFRRVISNHVFYIFFKFIET
jgi:hypothetical protein